MYELRPVERSPEGLEACTRLLATVFPHAKHLTNAYLDWQYNRNPAGTVVGTNAYSGETLAAHYVTLPIRAVLDGKPARGLLSLNTATHPEHQGKGLFTRLAEATYDSGAREGYAFVIGVANANSTPGFVRKLGFQLVAPLEARLGVGPMPRPADEGPIQYEATWDPELIRWRLANPSRRYRVVPVGDRVRIEAATGSYGINAILGALPRALFSSETDEGSAPLNPARLWLGIEPKLRWSPGLYLPLPDRLRPSPLNLIFRDLRGSGTKLAADALRFRALDFDAY